MTKGKALPGPEKPSRADEGCLLVVSVQPGALRTEIKTLMPDGSVRVGLKAPPVEGRANAELVTLLCRFFKVPVSSVRIVRGLTSKRKSVVIKGVSKANAVEMLEGVSRLGERSQKKN